MAYRQHGYSPPADYRRYGANPRSSTGGAIASSFDPRHSQYPRSTFDTLPPPRPERERSYDAQPIARRTYPEQPYVGGPARTRTDYAIRPRTNSAEDKRWDDRRRVPSVVLPTSPNRSRPFVNNISRDRSPLPPSRAHEDADRGYIYPASSGSRNHQRHYSATPTDRDLLPIKDRDRHERPYRAPAVASSRGGYPASNALVRYKGEDAFSYTGPEEQFAQGEFRPRPRTDSYTRRERPVSIIGPPEPRPAAPAKREPVPPPASKHHFDKIDRGNTTRSSGRPLAGSDNEYEPEIPQRRHSVKTPIAVHQDRPKAYALSREEIEDRRPSRIREDMEDRRPSKPRRDRIDEDNVYFSDRGDRDHQHASGHEERRHKKHRDPSPEKSHATEGLVGAGLGGVAAASLANAMSKDSRRNGDVEDEEPKKLRRRRRHRDKDYSDEETNGDPGTREHRNRDRPAEAQDERDFDLPLKGKSGKDRADSDSVDDEYSRRERRRHKHRDKVNIRPRDDSETGSDVRPAVERTRSKERDRDPNLDDHAPHRADRLEPAVHRDRSTSAPGESEDGRPRRVQLVEPVKDNQEVRPKGILKPPRAVPFPEDPNPTREGVAPLKEAGKEGVPPNARWTKINRKIVNPAALIASNERFEEREDHVIVLRVLSREEIEKLAEKTLEIRGKYITGP